MAGLAKGRSHCVFRVMISRLRRFAVGLRSPSSWAALAVVLVLEWLFQGWFHPSRVMTFAAFALGVALLGLWAARLGASDASAQRWRRLVQDAQKARRHLLEQVEADLRQVGSEPGLAQLDSVQRKFEALTGILERRLNAGELTHTRYRDAAEQVYLSVLDNLQDIAVSLKSISTIDRQNLEERLIELCNITPEKHATIKEIETLKQRKILIDKQLSKISDLFVQNERAMTALDKAAGSLADARLSKDQAATDLDRALHDLEQLAGRATRYAELSNT